MKNQKVINLLLDAKKSLEGIGDISSHIAAHKIEQSLFELGWKPTPTPNKNGKYILHTDGYKKEVQAVFDDNDKLIGLTDNEGNSWLKWAKDYDVLNPEVNNHYLSKI